jgi:3-hydroxyacyl-[acyl-carrier-protein] dehydratase
VSLDLAGVKRLIPHRYPMLLVDRVVEARPGVSLLALKAVTANEPWYTSDPPYRADHAYPPELVLESWCQAAGVLVSLDQPNPDVRTGRVTLFGSVTDARFLTPVFPGDVLRHRVRLLRVVADGAVFEGESDCERGDVLRVGRVVVALRPVPAYTGPGGAAPRVG